MKSRVAVLKTTPETVIEDYGRLMRMAGYQEFIHREKQTNLKTDLSWHVWFPACSTAPWQLEGVIKTMLDDGYPRDSLVLIQNCTGMIDDTKGEINNGHSTVAGRFGLEPVRLYEPPVSWIPYEPKGEMLVLDKIFQQDGIHIPDIFMDTNIVHMPTVKTDVTTWISGAMKNAFGGLVQEHSHIAPGNIDETLVDLLTIQKEIHSGLFGVMDGTICGDGQGPRMMMPYEKDYILAGADQVALDAVAAKMMGFDPMGVGYIRLAHERGLGCGVIDEIEIVGEDIADVNFHFLSKEETGLSRGLKTVAGGQAVSAESAFLRGPMARWPEAAARYYQDSYWYPFVGRSRVYDMAETQWGQLLQAYLPPGAELEKQGKNRSSFMAAAAATVLLGMGAVSRVAKMVKRM